MRGAIGAIMCCDDMDPSNKGNSCINQLGGVFLNGRPLPVHKRRMMIELASEGVRPCQISQILKVSSGCISKILSRYKKTGILSPKAVGGSRPRRLTPHVVSTIIQHKNASPNIFAWEIRQRLLAARICEAEKIPSVSSINRILRKMKTDTFASDGFYEEPAGGSGACAEHLFKSSYPQPSKAQQRSRTQFSPQQAETLQQEFLHNQERIATKINVPEDAIKVWSSNRRAKLRRESQPKQNNYSSHGSAPECSDKMTVSLTHRQDNGLTFAHRQYFQIDPSEMPTLSQTQNYPDSGSGLFWAHRQPLQAPFSLGYPQSEQIVNLTYLHD